jgi:hypothetical protein
MMGKMWARSMHVEGERGVQNFRQSIQGRCPMGNVSIDRRIVLK